MITRRHGIAEQTFFRWKSKCGCTEVPDTRRLLEPGPGNPRLKQLLAKAMLDVVVLQDVILR